jgi:hypothetical protein
MRSGCWRLCCVLVFLAVRVSAQVNSFAEAPQGDCSAALGILEQGGTKAAATELPLSHFGIGIGAETKVSGPDRVTEAAVVNGRIVVLGDQNTIAGVVLETHALSFPIVRRWAVQRKSGGFYVTDRRPCEGAAAFPVVAVGPFAALRVGDSQIVQSFGAGLMFGFRIKETDQSLNLGVAYMLQPQVKTLATGFADGQPLPAGETAVRFRIRSSRALALVLSFGW